MPLIQQFDTTMKLLRKVLDLRTQNQQIITSNIANADTPGYAPATLEFEEQLKNAMFGNTLQQTTTNPRHIPLSAPDLEHVEGTVTRTPDRTGIGDENGVSVDQEMIKLSENQIMYDAAVTMLNKKLAFMKYIANDGR